MKRSKKPTATTSRSWSVPSARPARREPGSCRQNPSANPGIRPAVLTTAIFAAMAPAASPAVSLGDPVVESRLGEPFSARIPLELSANETMASDCVSVPATGSGDLVAIPQPSIVAPEAVGPGMHELRVTTSQALYEPMYELQIQIRCAGTALLVRQYVLMLDLPAGRTTAVAAAGTEPARPVVAEAAKIADRPAAARSPALMPTASPLSAGQTYRVARGDTLFGIARRVADRGVDMRTAAAQIVAANPDAFIGGNPDLIKLGSKIVIPAAFTATTPAAEPMPVAQPVAQAQPQAVASAPAPAPVAAAEQSAPAVSVSEPATAAMTDAALDAPVEAPVGAAPDAVFADESAPVAAEAPPAPEAAVTAVVEEERSGAPEWLAALIGLLVGGGVSAVLLRDRLATLLSARKSAPRPEVASARSISVPAERTVSARVRRADETMVVVEEPPRDDTTEVPAAFHDVTDENPAVPARSFAPAAATPATASLFAAAKTAPEERGVDVSAIAQDAELDLDLSAASSDATIDQEFSWMSDETALTPTQQVGAVAGDEPDTLEQVDLQTMAQQATGNDRLSATLEEALKLLENDYEDEMTASQVLDRKRVERMMKEDAEDTLIRTGTDNRPGR